jgi:hypothetical protein
MSAISLSSEARTTVRADPCEPGFPISRPVIGTFPRRRLYRQFAADDGGLAKTDEYRAATPPRPAGVQRVALRVVEKRRVAQRLAINKAAWPIGVEGQHPIPKRLETNAARPGSLGSRTIKAAAASGN